MPIPEESKRHLAALCAANLQVASAKTCGFPSSAPRLREDCVSKLGRHSHRIEVQICANAKIHIGPAVESKTLKEELGPNR